MMGVSSMIHSLPSKPHSCLQSHTVPSHVKSVIAVVEILGYDDHLFHTASGENHCLHHLLPLAKSTKYALRVLGH